MIAQPGMQYNDTAGKHGKGHLGDFTGGGLNKLFLPKGWTGEQAGNNCNAGKYFSHKHPIDAGQLRFTY
jgi:hypothetical protein